MKGWIKNSVIPINEIINQVQSQINISNNNLQPKTDISTIKTRYLYPHPTDKRKIILKADYTPVSFKIDNKWCTFTENQVIDPVATLDTGTWTEAKDYNIYLCDTGSQFVFKTSLNTTYPNGFNENNSRKIGGFHTLCADVPSLNNHPLANYVAKDIIPNSIWDINHRPVSPPNGMVYVDFLKKWVDIYIASNDGNISISQKSTPYPNTIGTYIKYGARTKKQLTDLYQWISISNHKPTYYCGVYPNGGFGSGQNRAISYEGVENTGGIPIFHKILFPNICTTKKTYYLNGVVNETPVFFNVSTQRFVANIPNPVKCNVFLIYPDSQASSHLPVYVDNNEMTYGGSVNYGSFFVPCAVDDVIVLNYGVKGSGDRLHINMSSGTVGTPNGVWATGFISGRYYGDFNVSQSVDTGYANDRYVHVITKANGDIMELQLVDKYTTAYARFYSEPL